VDWACGALFDRENRITRNMIWRGLFRLASALPLANLILWHSGMVMYWVGGKVPFFWACRSCTLAHEIGPSVVRLALAASILLALIHGPRRGFWTSFLPFTAALAASAIIEYEYLVFWTRN
jgi:hypothetical protein